MKKSVNRYFQDYEKEQVPKKNGKGTKTVFKYVGDYYRLNISDGRWKTRKWVFPVLFLLFAAVYIPLALRDVPSNYVWYVGLPTVAMVFPAYFIIYGIVSYIVYKRDLTLREYRESVERLLYGSGAALALNLWIVVGEIIFLITSKSGEYVQLAGFALCLAVMALIFWLIYRSRKYTLIENPNGKNKKAS